MCMYTFVSRNVKKVHTPWGSFHITLLTTNTSRWSERWRESQRNFLMFSLLSWHQKENLCYFWICCFCSKNKCIKLTTERRENVKSKQMSGLWRAQALAQSWHHTGAMPSFQWKSSLVPSSQTLSKERPPAHGPDTPPIWADITCLENPHERIENGTLSKGVRSL